MNKTLIKHTVLFFSLFTFFLLNAQAATSSLITKTAKENLTMSHDFLTKNAKEPNVTTLPSGLQYKVITMGNGVKPTANQQVTVHYEGKLLDNTVFDSSYQRGNPITFGVKQVISGWQEGLQLMPVGSTWMLYIPANLAYGEQGIPGTIPGNAALIFKVELISIK